MIAGDHALSEGLDFDCLVLARGGAGRAPLAVWVVSGSSGLLVRWDPAAVEQIGVALWWEAVLERGCHVVW